MTAKCRWPQVKRACARPVLMTAKCRWPQIKRACARAVTQVSHGSQASMSEQQIGCLSQSCTSEIKQRSIEVEQRLAEI